MKTSFILALLVGLTVKFTVNLLNIGRIEVHLEVKKSPV